MQKGFWNGEPALFTGVIYEVTASNNPTHWQNRHVGKRRQGIFVHYKRQTFMIDNEHGDGYYKVTKGMGSPARGHHSVENPTNMLHIQDKHINTFYDTAALKKEVEELDQWTKENHPEVYEKIIAIREMLKKSPLLK